MHPHNVLDTKASFSQYNVQVILMCLDCKITFVALGSRSWLLRSQRPCVFLKTIHIVSIWAPIIWVDARQNGPNVPYRPILGYNVREPHMRNAQGVEFGDLVTKRPRMESLHCKETVRAPLCFGNVLQHLSGGGRICESTRTCEGSWIRVLA